MRDPKDLAEASDDQPREFIRGNLGRDSATRELWASLTRPPLAARVRRLLIEMQLGVEKDIRMRRWRREVHRAHVGIDHSSDYEREHREWHNRAVGFRLMVQDRLIQVREGAAEHNRDMNELVRRHRNVVRTLVKAIECHRHALETEVHAESADRKLWKILDEVTVPDGPYQQPVSLREMVDTYWNPETTRRNMADRTTRSMLSNADIGTPAS